METLQRPAPPPMFDDETTAHAVARFKALADRTRLGILAQLAASPEPICVCDLGAGFPLEQPTISHHLKVLRDAGLIVSERRANWAYYRLHAAAEAWVRDTLGGVAR